MSEIVLTPAQAVQLAVSVGDNAITTVVHPGPQGPPGVGIPSGGTSGDFLVKTSSKDYEVEWTDEPIVDKLRFDLAAAEAVAEGQLAWNVDEQTLDLGKTNGVVLQLGSEQLMLCRNSTASQIPNGTAVMFAGSLGNSGRLLVAPMVADGTYPGYVFFGITTHAINAGEDGFVTTFGKIRQVDTRLFEEGDVLWCDPAVPGGLTKTEPQAPNLKLSVAAVISKATNGVIVVRSDTGRRLQDLHDVEANGGKSDGDVLTYVAANNRWEAKANGIILESQQIINRNYTLSSGSNGVSQGPVSIGSGYTVTVPAGAIWGIL